MTPNRSERVKSGHTGLITDSQTTSGMKHICGRKFLFDWIPQSRCDTGKDVCVRAINISVTIPEWNCLAGICSTCFFHTLSWFVKYCLSFYIYPRWRLRVICMMTSSNGNIFRVTGPLCGEFTGPGEFPAQRPVTRSFDIFFDLRPNKRLSK